MEHQEKQEKLQEIVDQEFLTKLIEVGKIYGHAGDYEEIIQFIMYLHKAKGIPLEWKEIWAAYGDEEDEE